MVLLEQLLEKIVAGAPEKALTQAELAADQALLMFDRLERAYMDRVLQALRDPAFLACRGSWRVAHLLYSNWNKVPPEQRAAVFGALEDAYDKHGDFMGAFVIAVFAERLGGEPALQTFDRLMGCRRPARALIPHGLEYLGRDPRLRDAVVTRLNTLAADADAEVRVEAAAALAHLR